MNDRRRFASAAVLAMVGIISLFTVVSRPRFAAYHAPDMLQVFASGMCIGAALVRLAVVVRDRRSE